MAWLLDAVYLLALLLLSPWLAYRAWKTGRYRRGLRDKFLGLRQPLPVRHPVWFHGVSVGEIHLLRQVVAGFRTRYPGRPVVISTTTDTGLDEARKCFPDLEVFPFPLDFSWAARRTLRQVDPALVVLAESEIWPNFLIAAGKQRVPLAVINGRMSPRSYRRYRWVRVLARWLLRHLDLVAVQTEEYAANLRALGAPVEHVRVTGSVKFDGVLTDPHNPRTRELRRLLEVTEEDLVWIAGSTQAPEEEIVLDIYQRVRAAHPALRLFLVPRQKDRFDEVARLLERRGVPFVRRSAIRDPRSAVVLVDTIGELGPLWGLADVAFVGGSLDGRRGGQNMIEPAAFGAAIVFGPHVWNFRDTAERLVEAGATYQVADAAGLDAAVVRLLANAGERQRLGAAARDFVLRQQGATERTLDLLELLLAGKDAIRRVA
jgi:3-deoxy-D-manno-octulosonic-acid transferase